MRRFFQKFGSVFLVVILFVTSGCENWGAREKGAIGGAALGAGLGAIIGNQTGNAGAGIAIGSAIGAVSGGLIGNEIDSQQDGIDERQRQIDAQDREIAENKRLLAELRNKGVDARLTERGVVVNLPDVLFAFDRAELTPRAEDTVRDIANSLRSQAQGRSISVEGHTDSVGTSNYNMRLSEERAKSVARELTQDGLPRSSLRVHGYGESRPVASNDSDSGRQRNRRVEVIVENN